MVELERRGIPTVLFTAQTFVHDAHRSAASFGLAGLPLAVVPLPFTNQTPRDIQGMAERAFDQVQAGLTRPVEAPKAVELPPLDERLRYDGDDLLDAWGRMQADFLARGWSDGFPLVPPTERAVAALLRSTRRGPADVIATLEPGFGIATVEKLAINAVMAGCGPEHLPLLDRKSTRLNSSHTVISYAVFCLKKKKKNKTNNKNKAHRTKRSKV